MLQLVLFYAIMLANEKKSIVYILASIRLNNSVKRDYIKSRKK